MGEQPRGAGHSEREREVTVGGGEKKREAQGGAGHSERRERGGRGSARQRWAEGGDRWGSARRRGGARAECALLARTRKGPRPLGFPRGGAGQGGCERGA